MRARRGGRKLLHTALLNVIAAGISCKRLIKTLKIKVTRRVSDTTLTFLKMNGLGNDFVILDGRPRPVRISPQAAHAIADRRNGIGCDQVILLDRPGPGFSSGPDVVMRIFNADGSEVDACGNASRCVALILAAEKGRPDVVIQTNAGLLGALVNEDGSVTVDMGAPKFRWDEIPLSEEFQDTRYIELQVGPIDAPVLHSPSVVNVGNPHCIFFVDDVEGHDLGTIGPFLEHHMLFPQRANISLAQILEDGTIRLKVWERGAGLTRACGTAACAAAVCAARRRLTARKLAVHLPGGTLHIDWREGDDHILMTGPATLDHTGTLNPQDYKLALL